jgi:hypothetical protein
MSNGANEKTAKAGVWILTAEQIVTGLHGLSDELKLTPPQTAVVLQTTVEQLGAWRISGDGPPFVKLGEGPKAPVRYRLGTLRTWEAANTFSNTSMASVCRFGSLGDFLSRGCIQDDYLAAVEAPDVLWEFWESVRREVDIVEVKWMRMDEMLNRFRTEGNRRHAEREAYDLGTGVHLAKAWRTESL